MKVQRIYDIDGNLLYEGEATSRKAFVEQLVKEGKSLARSDLQHANLTHLRIDGGDFSGANLDWADLRGVSASNASFAGASMRGVQAQGMKGQRTDFSEADMTRHPDKPKKPGEIQETSFRGAILSFANLDRAKLGHTDFSECSMSKTSMVGTRAHRARFNGATLKNTNWADSKVTSCDFKDADMRPTYRADDKHLPDQTRGATIVGNTLDKARLGNSNSGFRWDRSVSKVARSLTVGGITTGFYVATSMLPVDVDLETLQSLQATVGGGISFAVVATAAILFRQKVEDFFKDKIGDWVSGINLTIRKGLAEAIKDGRSIASLAVAFIDSKHSGNVVKAMRDPGKNLFQRFKAVMSGQMEVLICDRKHLAEALSRISDSIMGRHRTDTDMILSRVPETPDFAPTTVVFRRDGSTEAHWAHPEAGTAYMQWDSEGTPTTPMADKCWLRGNGTRNGFLDTFIRTLILDQNVPELDFDSSTHIARPGKDGSVVILRESDRQLENRDGPVILTPEDEAIFYLR